MNPANLAEVEYNPRRSTVENLTEAQ